MKILTPEDLAWAAGFIEADGTITNNGKDLKIAVAQNEEITACAS